MSQLPEIPSSAYTPEMNTLGAIPDIPTFEGEPVPVSRNPLTSGTRPLQLLLLPGTEFPVCYATTRMHGFQTEVDLGKARAGGSSTDASAFWDLLDPPMRARVVAAGFGDYATVLRRTQPRFPPAMRYALMERWNDYAHTFVFGFREMTLTPAYYAAITGLRFAGPVAPLDARYQTATLGAQLVHSLLGVTTQTRYTVRDAYHTRSSIVSGPSGSGRGWPYGESCQWRLGLLLRPTPERRGIRPPGPFSSTSFLLSYYAPPRIREIRRCWYA
ncbi:hypothetical protein JCGZ_19670 [Jatropha curcas]|uniref:Aminotransferase-like plant mobile domain-containing protein n=1 Tax=Jatropha curcas TaxID=180498 RepID=A0A067LIH5_JATCU|nr:hypothetical protein JCGZ_19670 [Jatropha curcas]